MKRRIFLDTEWTAEPWSERCELMWVGLADEQGRVWSAISADADIEPERNPFIANVWKLISPDDPRSSLDDIAAGVVDFCADVDEFWAWIPSFESFVDWFGAQDDAREIYDRYRDWDLQVLRTLVDPWPATWPTRLCDLHAAAIDAGVELPPRRSNHLAPDVHVLWNRDLYERIERARA